MPTSKQANSSRNLKIVIIVLAVSLTVSGFAIAFITGFLRFGYSDFPPVPTPAPSPSASPSGDVYIPSNPQLILAISPSTVDRAEMTLFSVTSNYRNAPVTFEGQYEGYAAWVPFAVGTLGSSGACNLNMPADYAGFWLVRARAQGGVSNMVSFTVEGLTLYQDKSDWHVGENYTAALTGTYRNWFVAILHKSPAWTGWLYVASYKTNQFGVLPKNTASVILDASQANTDHEIIAVLSPTENGNGYIYDLMDQEVEGGIIISEDSLNGAVSSGQLVKSNILGLHILS
jgi:hypothetical protein